MLCTRLEASFCGIPQLPTRLLQPSMRSTTMMDLLEKLEENFRSLNMKMAHHKENK